MISSEYGAPSASLETLNGLLESIESIGLKEMDSVALMNRVDTKYVLSERALPELLEAIRDDYRILNVEGNLVSDYETLYYDTPDFQNYIQHHNGKLNRHKVRMRKYLSSDICFLEVKVKNNKKRTDKRRRTISDIEESLSTDLADYIQKQTGAPVDLEAKLWTCFSRITLVGRNLPERVTLDLGLTFRNDETSYALSNVVIAEVKQSSVNSGSPICKQLTRMQVSPLRVSKYCLGAILLDPEMKQNRFKSKLRTIRKIAL